MGICGSRHLPASLEEETQTVPKIPDRFETIEEVTQALRESGLESCQLIVGVDFTKSNLWTGMKSFDGNCLHSIDGPPNPYLRSLSLIARTLEDFDNDHLIPCYGFGDTVTQSNSVFSFFPGNRPANGLQELLERYRQIAPLADLSGPTSFAPLVREAMRHVYHSGMEFHLLLIIADGQISEACMQDTVDAITDAAMFPISIVMIGVGDGPWETMHSFDDALPARQWDNFQFVEFNSVMNNPPITEQRREASFALNALMEVPDQYKSAQYMVGTSARSKVKHMVDEISPSVLLEPSPLLCEGIDLTQMYEAASVPFVIAQQYVLHRS